MEKKSQEKWLHEYLAKGRDIGLVVPGCRMRRRGGLGPEGSI